MCRFISEMIQDTAEVTIEGEQETAPKLWNGTSFNDLQWPLTQISRSRYYSTSNNSNVVQDRTTYNGRQIESRLLWSIEWCHFQRPGTTPNQDLKVTPLFDAEYLRNGTRYRHNRDLRPTQRSFAINGPTAWNRLPPALQSPDLSESAFIPSSGHWRRTCSRPPGAIETF